MIPLFLKDGAAYVWNSDDWNTLRSEFRICGTLCSSIPSFPTQNDFLGLPMVLMSEEATLLVEKGVCELWNLPQLAQKPTEEEKVLYESLLTNGVQEQEAALRRRKIEQLNHKIDVIVAGKRQKLLSKGQTDVEIDKESLLQEEISKLPILAPNNILIHIPTSHMLSLQKEKVTTKSLQPNMFDIPHCIRYKIFKDMWEKGYYITSGSKFGCDYLLYPGDPVKFHATYMVRCILNPTNTFRPSELVAFGRLSVAVNKLAILAFCNAYGQLGYQTLQWHDSAS